MLLKRKDFDEIRAGRVSLAFRRWRKPTVRAGGTLRTWGVLLAIDAVDKISLAKVTDADAKRAGYDSRKEVIEALSSPATGDVYRIELHLAGPDPRDALRESLSDEEAVVIRRKLERYDGSGAQPWTRLVLELIATRPGVRAADLAIEARMDKDAFKLNVRKLKELGLTESLEIGYRLSPRGRKLLKRAE